ncbi:type II toxin-antitoxin system HicB family antitoxin [Myroides odoratimimus]|uniref:type II toxin-antitoxin system HicB family antitoxin n=1 Tax=Myroides odoratimimus TaxID=76832 RepID=UPI002574BDA6|nr:type II toxin-antitoxin system HicB family antitoxin [Myroides odoratimimus]MDM1459469.1 type II toxin-antitoxin system HicB family antitoxin [Myroides odoratimimus]MDM1520474.1 type II toxin-antitoxin system HicB family antitoxin [Myroides odoratimimus]
MRIKVILERSKTGYSAYSEELQGVVTVGDTFDEVKVNFKEVLSMEIDYLKELGNNERALELSLAEVVYYLDLNTFFDSYELFNKTKLATYLGINPSLLRRLSVEPVELSDKKAKQIQDGLHKLADELKEYHFV